MRKSRSSMSLRSTQLVPLKPAPSVTQLVEPNFPEELFDQYSGIKRRWNQLKDDPMPLFLFLALTQRSKEKFSVAP